MLPVAVIEKIPIEALEKCARNVRFFASLLHFHLVNSGVAAPFHDRRTLTAGAEPIYTSYTFSAFILDHYSLNLHRRLNSYWSACAHAHLCTDQNAGLLCYASASFVRSLYMYLPAFSIYTTHTVVAVRPAKTFSKGYINLINSWRWCVFRNGLLTNLVLTENAQNAIESFLLAKMRFLHIYEHFISFSFFSILPLLSFQTSLLRWRVYIVAKRASAYAMDCDRDMWRRRD